MTNISYTNLDTFENIDFATFKTQYQNGTNLAAQYYAELAYQGNAVGNSDIVNYAHMAGDVVSNEGFRGVYANAFTEISAAKNNIEFSVGSDNWLHMQHRLMLNDLNARKQTSDGYLAGRAVSDIHSDALDFVGLPNNAFSLYTPYNIVSSASPSLADIEFKNALTYSSNPLDIIEFPFDSLSVALTAGVFGTAPLSTGYLGTLLGISPASAIEYNQWLANAGQAFYQTSQEVLVPIVSEKMQQLLTAYGHFLTGGASEISGWSRDINNTWFHGARITESPLVLDLDGDGIEVTRLGYEGQVNTTHFDMDNDGFADRTAWITGGDGLLTLDRNNNGTIDNQQELFGNYKISENPHYFQDGFSALRELDSNADNLITSADTQWSDLKIWVDVDQDGVSQASELKTLNELDIVSIDLNATNLTSTVYNGNPVTLQSTYTKTDNSVHEIADVWFTIDPMDTRPIVGNTVFDPMTVMLPEIRGSGQLLNLRASMSADSELRDMIVQFVLDWSPDRLTDVESMHEEVKTILFRWAKVENVAIDSRGDYMDARVLEFIEEFVGREYMRAGNPVNSNPGDWANGGGPAPVMLIEGGFNKVVEMVTLELVAQIAVGSIFEEPAEYNFAKGRPIGGTFSAAALEELSAIAATLDVTNDGYNDSEHLTFWKQVVSVIATVRDQDPLTVTEIALLNDAIQASGPNSWADVEIWFNTVIADHLSDGSSNDEWIEGSAYADVLGGVGGNDVIHGRGGDDIIYATYYGETGASQLYGDAGNDTIYGSALGDTISGGTGNNYIVDGAGDELYIYEAGHDTIVDQSGTDLIEVKGSFSVSDLSLQRAENGVDLEVYLDAQKVITIINHFVPGNAIEQIVFDDSTSLNLAAFADAIGTDGDDVLVGNDQALMAKDIMFGFEGNDTLSGGVSDDTMYGGIGDDVLFGEADNDKLFGDDGDDTLSGGTGVNTLQGGLGSDEYQYAGGSDVIIDEGGSADKLKLGAGYTLNNTHLVRDGLDLLVYSGSTLLLRVSEQFATGKSIETLVFGDNSTLDLPAVQYTTNGTSAADYIVTYGNGDAWDIINGFEDDDLISSGAGNDTVAGGSGNDTIDTSYGDDTVIYDSGVDYLTEVQGTDIIQVANTAFTAADVSVERTVNDQLNVSLGGNLAFVLTTQFAQNAGFETIKFADNSVFNLNAVQYTTNGTSSTDYLYGISYGGNINDIINGFNGDDFLYGGLGDDLLNGGSGLDRLEGGEGNDFYAITFNNGADTIYDTAGSDTIEFSTGFSLSNMTLVRNQANLEVKFGGVKAVTIENQFNGAYSNGVETIHFANNDTVNLLTTALSITGTTGADSLIGWQGIDHLYGGNGNDYLDGYSGNDRLEGGAGDDTVNGGTGDDAYYYTSGHDYFNEAMGEGTDSIYLPSTWLQSGTYFWNDVSGFHIYKSGSTANDILIGSMGSAASESMGNVIERIVFGDSSVIDLSLGLQMNDDNNTHSLYGSEIGDLIKANGGDDTVYGQGGNDTIYGGAGADWLFGTNGYDLIFGDANNDQIYGGNDDDTIWGGANDDNLYGDAGNDTLNGDAGIDALMGGEGNDVLYGGNDVDTLSGGDDNDTLYGGAGNDYLIGDAGNDILYGGANNDTLHGDYGDDVLYGNAGTNYLWGEFGADTFKFGVDSIDGAMDYIQDFNVADGDKIDIHDMLIGFNPLTSAIADFVNMTDSAGNTLVKIDRDGAGTAYAMTSFATITGVIGLTDEQALHSAGQIVT